MRMFAWISAAALSAGVASMSFGQVTGSVTLDGDAPEMAVIDMSGQKDCANQHSDPVSEETVVAGEKGELANVVISVKTDDPASLGGEVPKKAAMLDQKGCVYTPHVVAVMTGQEFIVKNDDAFMHNVQSFAKTNPPFNIAQPNKEEKKIEPFKAAEEIQVKCQVHPWMVAYIHVFEHPFFAVSDAKGKFKIDGKLPDGEYTFVAKHENLGEQEATAEVKDGKAEVNFKFSAEGAMAEPEMPKGAQVKLASNEEASEGCCSGAEKAKKVIQSFAAKSE
jgi:hypothetical protein